MTKKTQGASDLVPTAFDDLWADFLAFDWQTVIVAAMEHLGWPIVTLVIALAFKPELSALIYRLKNLKGKGFSAEFAELDKASEDIKEDVQPYKAPEVDDLLQIARIKPTAAVVEAWKELEFSMIELISSKGYSTRDGRRQINGHQLMRDLLEREAINKNEFHVLNELRIIRNKAAHSVDSDVSIAQAEQYVEMALAFANKFNQAPRKPQQ